MKTIENIRSLAEIPPGAVGLFTTQRVGIAWHLYIYRHPDAPCVTVCTSEPQFAEDNGELETPGVLLLEDEIAPFADMLLGGGLLERAHRLLAKLAGDDPAAARWCDHYEAARENPLDAAPLVAEAGGEGGAA